MMNRRKFITQSSLLASVALLPGTLMSFTAWNEESTESVFDVIIVGGSYSGLSAAMALGRSLRKVLIIDNGKPCNRYASHSHNFITQDATQPGEIAGRAKAQVLKYETVLFHQDNVSQVLRKAAIFEVGTERGKRFSAKKILFATGLRDIMPDIRGFQDCWGISVLHCPYCHGYEVRKQATGILGNGNLAFHYAQLVSNLTDQLTIFTNGKAEFTPRQSELIKRNRIPVVEKKVLALEHNKGKLAALILEDHSTCQLTTLYARPAFEQHCNIPRELGCITNELGLFVADRNQETNIPGIYACGDNSAFRSIAVAVSTGSQAGAGINAALSIENFK